MARDLFDLDRTYPIASPMPIIFFAVLFGLSMDYEVPVSHGSARSTDATGDNAPRRWLGARRPRGARITSAALIMTVVFASFVADPSPLVKMLGLGLSTAIVLDATIVRMVLVPATMALDGPCELVAAQLARPPAAPRAHGGRRRPRAAGANPRQHPRARLMRGSLARQRVTMVEMLAALANPIRLRIIARLAGAATT